MLHIFEFCPRYAAERHRWKSEVQSELVKLLGEGFDHIAWPIWLMLRMVVPVGVCNLICERFEGKAVKKIQQLVMVVGQGLHRIWIKRCDEMARLNLTWKTHVIYEKAQRAVVDMVPDDSVLIDVDYGFDAVFA